jgi:hypothetical protein
MNLQQIWERRNSILVYVIPLIIAMGLFVVEFRQIEQLSTLYMNKDIRSTFTSFTAGLKSYEQIQQEWRPRVLSNFIAGRFVNLFNESFDLSIIVGLWTSTWLLLISIALIIEFKERSLFYIFGIFAGISFGYTNSIGSPRVFPWDMPALFIYVTFLILVKNKKFNLLIPFIPIAMLFKETAIVMIITFLFMGDYPFKKRVIYLLFTALLCFLLKTGVDIATHNPALFLTMTWKRSGSVLRSLINVRTLIDLQLDTPLLINSGLLLSMMIIPSKTKMIQLFKIIALIFLVSNFVFGIINEYRIWFEIIPLSLFALQITFYPDIGDQKIEQLIHQNKPKSNEIIMDAKNKR